ncbi:MAG: Crp/Fnr family transcriptional regulator [Gallionella sp.]|nr:Crp/Fnr family transcriptional regulator [Gallionella sp.]
MKGQPAMRNFSSPNANPSHNQLLAAIQPDKYARLLPHLELISIPLGQVLHEPSSQLRHVYFPINAIVSLLHITEGGATMEIAMVGDEGMVGVSSFTDGETTPYRAVVLSTGLAYRLKAQLLNEELNRAGGRRTCETQNLFLRYTQALMTQTAQTAVCNRHHSVDQQLCRCLLQIFDRVHSNELTMTQELIANILGVRREGITEAAGKLQRAGLIEYHRGHITVIDRHGLEALACECYKVVKQEFNRLLPQAAVPNHNCAKSIGRDPTFGCDATRQGVVH